MIESPLMEDKSNSGVDLNPKAPRKYKTLTIPMNKHEYDLLTALAERYGQSHNGIIRCALKELEKKQL